MASDWMPTDEQVETAARAIGAWALDTLGLGVPVLLCDETPSDPHGPWDHPTPHAFDVARAVLAAVGPAIRAQALTEAADALEGRLGIEGAPRDLWEFREWLRARAGQTEADR